MTLKTFTKSLFTVGLIAVASTAMAKEQPLNDQQIQQLLSEQTIKGLHYKKETRQYFAKSGLTLWISDGDKQPAEGRWKVENSQYCSSWNGLFNTPKWNCYQVSFDEAQGLHYFLGEYFRAPFVINAQFELNFD